MKKWGWRSETCYITYRPYEDKSLSVGMINLNYAFIRCLYVNENPLITTVQCPSELHSKLFSLAKPRSFSRKHLQPPWLPHRCHHTSSESTNWEFPEHSFGVSLNSQRSNSSKMCRTKVYHIKRHSQLHDKRSLLVSIPTSLIYCCFGDCYVLCEWTFPGEFKNCDTGGVFEVMWLRWEALVVVSWSFGGSFKKPYVNQWNLPFFDLQSRHLGTILKF